MLYEVITLNDLPGLRRTGAGVLRLLPQSERMREVIGLFADALAGQIEADAAFARSREFMKDDPCNGFWHGRAGVDQFVSS